MNGKCHPHRRAGFTLLELLISSALTATLLVMVWSLFSIYTKLNDRGVVRATELQIVRALMQQFRADLRQVISQPPRRLPVISQTAPPPISVSQNESASPLPMGPELIGTPTSLQFVVRSIREPLPPPRRDDRRESAPPLLMPYDQIRYHWQKMTPTLLTDRVQPTADVDSRRSTSDSGLEEDEDELPAFGLARRVTPWHRIQQSSSGSIRETSARELPNVSAQSEDEEAPRLTVDEVPEVVRLRFRYSDGRRWQSSWNSQVQQRLPAAIEISFEIEDPERYQERLLDPSNGQLPGDSRIETAVPLAASEEPVVGVEEMIGGSGPGMFGRESSWEYRLVIAVDPYAVTPSAMKAGRP